jgi:hypothetical protein
LQRRPPVAHPYLTAVSIDLAQTLDGNPVSTLAMLASPDLRLARVLPSAITFGLSAAVPLALLFITSMTAVLTRT